MEETNKNQREVLIHIICEYYNVSKKDIIENQRLNHWVVGDVVSMFSYLSDNLSIGTPPAIAEHIGRHSNTVWRYINVAKDKALSNDSDFDFDKENILRRFFMKEKYIFKDYFFDKIPKERMPEFIEYIEKFTV